MDGSNPDSGGGGCGECELNDDGKCDLCVMLRDIYSWNPKSDGKKQSPVPTSNGSSSSGSGSGGKCEMNDDDSAKQFLVVASNGSRDTSDNGDSGCGVECKMNDDGAKQFLIMASDGFRDTSRLPQEVGCNLWMIPESDRVEVAPDGSKCAEQVVMPDSRDVQIPDKKVLDIARTKKLEIPLHVAAMNKGNVNLKDSSVYLPLPHVVNLFNDEASKAIIQILDQSGHEKTSSCLGIENSSSTEEMSGDSVYMVDPPPPAVFYLSSSDDDDVVGGRTSESCKARKRVRRSCANTQKMASTSSPCTKSGSGGRKGHDQAKTQKMASTSSPCTKSGSGGRKPHANKLRVGSKPLSNKLGGPFQPPYILPQTGTILPCQVKKKIEEKVQAIGSDVPLFVRVMSLSNVDAARATMGFCMEYALGYLPKRRMALSLQLEGEQTPWETMMAAREDRWMRIYKGWMEFAAHYGLEVGDICLFQLTSCRSYRNLTMTVHLIRKSEVEP